MAKESLNFHREHTRRKKARGMLSRAGYKSGGHIRDDEDEDKKLVEKGVHEHEAALHKGQKKTHLKLKHGGVADGMMPKSRPDKRARGGGGGKKGGHHVTIVNVGNQRPPMPMIPPRPPVPVPTPNMAAAAPRPPMPGGPPPGAGMGPPPGLKKGGRVRKKGGRTYPLDAGSDSGEGRIQKGKAYGARV